MSLFRAVRAVVGGPYRTPAPQVPDDAPPELTLEEKVKAAVAEEKRILDLVLLLADALGDGLDRLVAAHDATEKVTNVFIKEMSAAMRASCSALGVSVPDTAWSGTMAVPRKLIYPCRVTPDPSVILSLPGNVTAWVERMHNNSDQILGRKLRPDIFDLFVAMTKAHVDAPTISLLLLLMTSAAALARAVADGDRTRADVEAQKVAEIGCELAGIDPLKVAPR